MPHAKTSTTDEMPRDENLNTSKPVSLPGHVDEHEHEAQPDHEPEHGHIEPFDLLRIAVTVMVAGMVWFRVWEPFREPPRTPDDNGAVDDHRASRRAGYR
jgi:hypothetical protein